MKIDRITLTHVRIPLVETFKISNGEVREKDGILVSIDAEGVTGVGEASPMAGGFYSEETPEGTWEVLREKIVPAVLTRQPGGIVEANVLLDEIGGNPFARCGVETAFWDLEARWRNVPLHVLLGSSHRAVASGLAVGITPTLADLVATVERYMTEGYLRLKIKIQPGWDVKPLEEMRRVFGDIPLMVDANCAYDRGDIDHLAGLDRFGLMMIEQPLKKKDLEGHAILQRRMTTPLCLDESAENAAMVKQALLQGSCKVINIKVQRVGGLHHAVAIHDLCAAAQVPVWAGTMPELGVGGVQAVHLAMLPGFRFPTDVESSRRWFVDDIVEPLITVENGMIAVPPGAGMGYALNTQVIRKFTVREELLRG
jgi:o-succinylbenzoate synthase